MATYAIGDIQGCYDELMELLNLVHFDPVNDRLWCVGDLINRGPKSLDMFRYLMTLPHPPVITLGNHDLHFLAVATKTLPPGPKDTFHDCLAAPDLQDIINWLSKQPLIHDDPKAGFTMVHAGIPPQWDLVTAIALATEVSTMIQSPQACEFYRAMYSNQPDLWGNELKGMTRLRVITNYLTRMRFCDKQGRLELKNKISRELDDPAWQPWFTWPREHPLPRTLIFGHWAAIEGKTNRSDILALDTGCVWGGKLTALRLDDRQIFCVPSHQPLSRE